MQIAWLGGIDNIFCHGYGGGAILRGPSLNGAIHYPKAIWRWSDGQGGRWGHLMRDDRGQIIACVFTWVTGFRLKWPVAKIVSVIWSWSRHSSGQNSVEWCAILPTFSQPFNFITDCNYYTTSPKTTQSTSKSGPIMMRSRHQFQTNPTSPN